MSRAFVPRKILSCCLLAIGLGASASLAQQPSVQPSAPASPLDQPIAWMQEAKNNFTRGVHHYECTLIKQERVRGVLQEQNIIMFTSKVQPFSVHMKWVAPAKLNGQEVVYVEGRNDNKMRVKAKGLGILGFMSIDVHDPRVMQHSRHNIREAGLGNMIEENLKNWQVARPLGKTRVEVNEKYTWNNRPCIRIETTNTERLPQFYCETSVIYLEKESKIPMRLENYDWRLPGAQTGDLLEEFSFADLNFRGVLRESLFTK